MNYKFKITFTLILTIIYAGIVAGEDTIDSHPDSTVICTQLPDSASLLIKEYQIHYYHLRALLEYQEMLISKYLFIIYLLSGILFIIMVYIILKYVSGKYIHSFKLYKCKKSEMVPAVSLRMILRYWNIKVNNKSLYQAYTEKNKNEMSVDDLVSLASVFKLRGYVIKTGLKDLLKIKFPVLVYYHNHIAIIYKIKNQKIYIADPFYGYLIMDPYYFVNSWYLERDNEKGIAVAFIPDNNMDKKLVSLSTTIESFDKPDKRQLKQLVLYFNNEEKAE